MRSAQRERGSAVVEFALVVPLLLVMVFGIAEFGRAYHISATLTGAARQGVRVMALQNDPAAARAAVRNAAPTLGLTDSQISVTPSSCVSTATSTANATVQITYATSLMTGLFGPRSITLRGTGVMRCNG